MRDQPAVPDAVQVAGAVAAGVGAEDRDRDVVAAVADAERVERLVEIADEVHEELQRDRAVRAIERGVGEPRLVVEDPIHRAVAPRVGPGARRHAGLPRAIAIAIVAGRLRRNVEEVPVERLVGAVVISIGPRRDVGEALRSEQPGDVPARDRRQPLGGEQRDEPMSLPAPRLQSRRRRRWSGARARPPRCEPRSASRRLRRVQGAVTSSAE